MTCLYFRTAQTRAGRSLLAGSQHEQNIYIGIVLAAGRDLTSSRRSHSRSAQCAHSSQAPDRSDTHIDRTEQLSLIRGGLLSVSLLRYSQEISRQLTNDDS